MGMTSTYINRANTNQRLLAPASDAACPNPGDIRKALPFSRNHEARRAKLLGHVLRSSDVDPLRQVSFTPSSASRIDYGKKGVGRPRLFMKTSKTCPATQKLLSKTSGHVMHPCEAIFNTKVLICPCPCCVNALLSSDFQQSQQGRAENKHLRKRNNHHPDNQDTVKLIVTILYRAHSTCPCDRACRSGSCTMSSSRAPRKGVRELTVAV